MIYLSAGHSNKDPGAVAEQIIDGRKVLRKEAEIVAEFRNYVSFYLMRNRVDHQTDGTGTSNMDLSESVKLARNNRPAVEFHCNAASDPRASGVEALSAPKDLVLSASLCKAVSDVLGIKNRGAKPEDSGQHHRLAFVQAGGIILELFFISNPRDLALYDSMKWKVAKAVAEVIAGVPM